MTCPLCLGVGHSEGYDCTCIAPGRFAALVEGTEPEPAEALPAESYVPPPGLWTMDAVMASIGVR